jgi:hypothetical protein
MIASNYITNPAALQYQREMFSNGYHNSPRIMRLMQVVFSWHPSMPKWVKESIAKAKALAKTWKASQLEISMAHTRTPSPTTPPNPRFPGAPIRYRGPMGETWSGRGLMPRWLAQRRDQFNEDISAYLVNWPEPGRALYRH